MRHQKTEMFTWVREFEQQELNGTPFEQEVNGHLLIVVVVVLDDSFFPLVVVIVVDDCFHRCLLSFGCRHRR